MTDSVVGVQGTSRDMQNTLVTCSCYKPCLLAICLDSILGSYETDFRFTNLHMHRKSHAYLFEDGITNKYTILVVSPDSTGRIWPLLANRRIAHFPTPTATRTFYFCSQNLAPVAPLTCLVHQIAESEAP